MSVSQTLKPVKTSFKAGVNLLISLKITVLTTLRSIVPIVWFFIIF